MSNNSGKGAVVNWRGPLLAAGIFATVFGVLLLMAHQNESKTSDMGSSLREDPYGTSLVFNSYGRAGYEVKRSQDQDSLYDQNPLNTTAFFIGGRGYELLKLEKGKVQVDAKFRSRLEDFLARGGRVVLVAPAWKFKSESQGWEVENEWSQTPVASGPTWISPGAGTMPSGSEKIFLGTGSPWLKTDAAWTALYSGTVDPNPKPDSPVRVYMAMRTVGKGELIVASQESFLLNEAIKARPNPVLLDFLTGGRRVIWVDETLHGLHQDQGVLWLLQRYRLQVALLLFWATLLVLLWSMSGDLVRRPARDQSVQVVRQGEGAGVAARRLLQRSITPRQVVSECWEQFRRRSPHDAQAISTDPHFSSRLREALAQAPLTGYTLLSRLVAERRAAAKGLARSGRHTTDGSTSPQKKASEEARFG